MVWYPRNDPGESCRCIVCLACSVALLHYWSSYLSPLTKVRGFGSVYGIIAITQVRFGYKYSESDGKKLKILIRELRTETDWLTDYLGEDLPRTLCENAQELISTVVEVPCHAHTVPPLCEGVGQLHLAICIEGREL